MEENKLCIVIPIYTDKLNIADKVSLNKFVDTINKKRKIYFVTHEDLKADVYKELFGDKVDYDFMYFDKRYFNDTASYSQMLLDPSFYKRFIDEGFDYMLIYQTDCYLIKDDLDEWVNKGYDYIGAPILSNHIVWKTCPTVGNGGFSLRKLSTFYDICRPDGPVLSKYKDILKPEEVTIEDLYFCESVYELYDFTRPDVLEAGRFAIDFNPDAVMNNNDRELPTGLHAFDKLVHYWKNVIPELNDKELIDYSYNKYFKDGSLANRKIVMK